MSAQYNLMVHFVVSMMHQHRLPTEGYATLGEFHEKHRTVVDEICKSAIDNFQYELSSSQIGYAIGWYLKATGCYPMQGSSEAAQKRLQEAVKP